MSTNYERGRQYEYKSMRFLEASGYETLRTAGSHGPVDVIGYNAHSVVFVQIKFNCEPSGAEIEQLKLLPVPTNVTKLIHRWDYRKSSPRVTVV